MRSGAEDTMPLSRRTSLWSLAMGLFVFNFALFQLLFHGDLIESHYSTIRRPWHDSRRQEHQKHPRMRWRKDPALADVDDKDRTRMFAQGGTPYVEEDSNGQRSKNRNREKVSGRSKQNVDTWNMENLVKYRDAVSPTDESMAEYGVNRFKLLWRGIASLIVHKDFQSDPTTSWNLIDEQLKQMSEKGIVLGAAIDRLRSGEHDPAALLRGVPHANEFVSKAIVSYLIDLIESKEHVVDPIDGIMLLKNLLDNRWRKKQREARLRYFEMLRQRNEDTKLSRRHEANDAYKYVSEFNSEHFSPI